MQLLQMRGRLPRRIYAGLSGLGDAAESQRILLNSQIAQLEQSMSQCSGGEGEAQICAAQKQQQIDHLRQALAAIDAAPAAKPLAIAAAITAPQGNPDPRSGPERAEADRQVRMMSDAQVREAVYGDQFSGAVYLKNNPDVANDPYWGKNPERHFLAYGQYEGRAYPTAEVKAVPATPTTPPLPAGSKLTVTDVPSTFAPIPSFAPAPAPAAATINPLAVSSLAPVTNAMQLTPGRVSAQGIDREIERQAQQSSGLPSWAIPVGLAAAALLLIPLLAGGPAPAPAPAPAPTKRTKGKR